MVQTLGRDATRAIAGHCAATMTDHYTHDVAVAAAALCKDS